MIWLASFPRSGNTFFRNVLYEVYGLESSTFHQDKDRPLDEDYASYPFVKTHLLPDQLEPSDPDMPAVYLVRDGRDALVSLAHHRKDIVEPGSDLTHNLIEAIIARGGSHFGGWSENVRAWSQRAVIIIKFEDLIEDPIREVEKLRSIVNLPEPKLDKLPDFEMLKYGQPKYGGGQASDFKSSRNQQHFRKGRVGSHREEMSPFLERLFWNQHGPVMKKTGYVESLPEQPRQKNILIEGSKFFNEHMDGIGRYVQSLVHFLPIILEHQPDWNIDLFHKNQVIPVVKAKKEKEENPEQLVMEHGYEQKLLVIKEAIKKVTPGPIYQPIRNLYVRGPWRKWLKALRQGVSRQQIQQLKKDLSEVRKTYDLIHAPVPQGLTLVQAMDGPFLTTVHDVTHHKLPGYHTEANISETEEGMRLIDQTGSHVLCVSGSTQKDLVDHYKIDSAKTSVIYEGIDPDVYHPRWRETVMDHLNERYNLPQGPFILSLSTLEPRKNITGTINAFRILAKEHPDLDVSLVIAGRKGWKWEEIMSSASQIEDRIYFTGYIEEEHLPYVYTQAKVFCYPSFYEGFGLPLVEAMGCGTPVIYGNNSAMIEVVGDHGLAVDPDDPDNISRAMSCLLTDRTMWQELSTSGRGRANQLTWLKSALKTLEYYDKIITS